MKFWARIIVGLFDGQQGLGWWSKGNRSLCNILLWSGWIIRRFICCHIEWRQSPWVAKSSFVRCSNTDVSQGLFELFCNFELIFCKFHCKKTLQRLVVNFYKNVLHVLWLDDGGSHTAVHCINKDAVKCEPYWLSLATHRLVSCTEMLLCGRADFCWPAEPWIAWRSRFPVATRTFVVGIVKYGDCVMMGVQQQHSHCRVALDTAPVVRL